MISCLGPIRIAATLLLCLAATGAQAQANDPGEQAAIPGAVKAAISALKASRAKPPAAGDPRCSALVGSWRGFGMDRVMINADGTTRSKAGQGSWTCTDPAGRKFALDLPAGGRLTLSLDARGARAAARDGAGRMLVGHKDADPKVPAADAVVPSSPDCAKLAGHWLWPDGQKVTLNKDGLALSDKSPSGRWRCLDAGAMRAAIYFGTAREDEWILSADDARLETRDAAGRPRAAERRP